MEDGDFGVPLVYDKQQLMTLVRQKALKFGQFTLASGRKATYYLDGKQVTLDPTGARLVAEGILDLFGNPGVNSGKVAPLGGTGVTSGKVAPMGGTGLATGTTVPMPAAIGGMSIGADPITAAVITMSAVRGTPLVGFMVRKEPKGHGTNQYLEGPVTPGMTALIVEDVVTTGGSSLLAIDRAEQFGLKIIGIAAIIDRMEGGAEAFAGRGYPFLSLLSIRDFGIESPGDTL